MDDFAVDGGSLLKCWVPFFKCQTTAQAKHKSDNRFQKMLRLNYSQNWLSVSYNGLAQNVAKQDCATAILGLIVQKQLSLKI